MSQVKISQVKISQVKISQVNFSQVKISYTICMPRRTNIITISVKLVATNSKISLETTPIICRQSCSVLFQVTFLKSAPSEVKISKTLNVSKKLYHQKALNFWRRFQWISLKHFPISFTYCLGMLP